MILIVGAAPVPRPSILPSVEQSELEKADKIIQMKRKPKHLDPLNDHTRKQF